MKNSTVVAARLGALFLAAALFALAASSAQAQRRITTTNSGGGPVAVDALPGGMGSCDLADVGQGAVGALACRGFAEGAAALPPALATIYDVSGKTPAMGTWRLERDSTVNGQASALGDTSFFSAGSETTADGPGRVKHSGAITFSREFDASFVVVLEGVFRFTTDLTGAPRPVGPLVPFVGYYDFGLIEARNTFFPLAPLPVPPKLDFSIAEPGYAMEVTAVSLYIFQPIPEPGTWALMAAGLLGVGWVARRRAKQA